MVRHPHLCINSVSRSVKVNDTFDTFSRLYYSTISPFLGTGLSTPKPRL